MIYYYTLISERKCVDVEIKMQNYIQNLKMYLKNLDDKYLNAKTK